MKFMLPLIGALMAAGLFAGTRSARDPIQSALPPHSQLLQTASIAGNPKRTAVVYGLSGPHMGIVAVTGDGSRLIWSKPLHVASPRLVWPVPQHVFAADGVNAHKHELMAFTLHGSSVRSAIDGRSNATVAGDEGVTMSLNQITVRNRDQTHVGSVRYRLLSKYRWLGNLYKPILQTQVPDYANGHYPVPNGTIHTKSGNILLLKLEIANTEPLREYGLMNRKSLDPDSGMIFVWTQPVQDGFWMQNTYIPLTVAFLDAGGKILEMMDMEPLTTTLHTPSVAYSFAIEVNRGYFTANGVAVGDVVKLHI